MDRECVKAKQPPTISRKWLPHEGMTGGASGIRTPDLRIMIPSL